MNISQKGIDLIASFEGCRLTAYWDATGKVWTIGYGHTRGVYQGMTITQQQAEDFLREDCATAEKNVRGFDSKYHWNQNEFDALVSFAFNVGSINQLTANGTRTRQQIAYKLPAYNKSGGIVLNGLTRRRLAEQALFLTPVEPETKPDYSRTGWIQESNGKWWYAFGQMKGEYYKDTWAKIDGLWYYFGLDGYAVTDWQQINGHWYYMDPNKCYMKTGWEQIDGKWYYFQEGGTLDGALWHQVDDGGALGIWEL